MIRAHAPAPLSAALRTLAATGVLVAVAASLPRVSRAEDAPGPTFAARDDGLAIETGRLRVALSRTGLRFETGSPQSPLAVELRLEAISMGGVHVLLAGERPALETPVRALFRHGEVDEVYEPRGECVEQAFRIARLPGPAGADVVLEERISTALDALLVGAGLSGVAFRSEGRTVLSYGAAVAIDAAGVRSPARMTLDGDLLEIRIDGAFAAAAALPITVDPVLAPGVVVVAAAPDVQTRSDAAYSAVRDDYLFVYDDDQGTPGANHAVMAGRFLSDGTPLDLNAGATADAVTLSSLATSDAVMAKTAWLGPTADELLVAWLNRRTSTIEGALVSASPGGPLAVTRLAQPIAVTLAGDTDIVSLSVGGREDDSGFIVVYDVVRGADVDVRGVLLDRSGSQVGGALSIAVDPARVEQRAVVSREAASGQPWLVGWTRQTAAGSTTTAIAVRTVDAAGNLGAVGTVATTATGIADFPALAGRSAPWLVAFSVSSTASGVHSVLVDLAGAGGPTGTAIAVPGTSVNDDQAPAVAASFDEFLVAWVRAVPIGGTDIFYARYDQTASVREGPVNLTNVGGGPTFLRPAAAARVRAAAPPFSTYLVAYERVVSATANDPRFVFAGGPAPLEVREGGPGGPLIVSGSAAVGGRDFGVVSGTAAPVPPVVISIASTGGAPISVQAPALVAGSTGDFTLAFGTPFPVTLAAGQSVTFAASFTPASDGVKQASVLFTSSLASSTPFTFGVAGERRPATFRASAAPNAPISPGGAFLVGGALAGSFVSSTITATIPGRVVAVKVTNLDISYDTAPDLVLFLRGPNGVRIPLALNRGTGTASQAYVNTVFDDAGATPVAAGSDPFNGDFRPELALASFTGITAAGSWTLMVGATGAASLSGGNLLSWTLIVEVANGPAMLVREASSGRLIGSGDPAYGSRAFGGLTLGSSTSTAIEVDNFGTADLHVGSAGVTGTAASEFQTLSAPLTVTPGASASFTVVAQPGSVGSKEAAISFTHDGQNTPSPFVFGVEAFGSNLAGALAANATPFAITTSTPLFTQPLAVSAPGTILDVAAGVDITYPNDADLVLTLVHPDGTRVLLASALQGANYTATRLDDRAPRSITTGAAPFSGSFAPASPLAALAGKPAAGTWLLEVGPSTPFGFGASGTLNSFSLDIVQALTPAVDLREGSAHGPAVVSGAPAQGGRSFGLELVSATARPVTLVLTNVGSQPLQLSQVTSSGSVLDFSLPASLPATLGPGVSATFTASFTPTGAGPRGASLTFTHNGTLAGPPSPFTVSFAGVGVTGFANPQALTSADPPVPVPDNLPAGASATIVSNLTGFLATVTATISISHPAVQELSVLLVAPDGTTVSLVVPGAAAGPSFTSTTFDDTAPVSIASLSAFGPYTGSFAPVQPLATLRSRRAAGVWTLLASDATPGNAGTITGFSLSVTTVPTAPAIMELRDAGALVASGAAPSGGRDFGFGQISAAQTVSLFTVTNAGGSTLQLGAPVLSTVTGDFVLGVSSFATSMSPGATTSFTVTFRPQTTGRHSAAVFVANNAPGTPSPFELDVTGLGVASAPIVASTATPAAIPAFSTIVIPTPSAGPAVALDVVVTLDVTYPVDGDLTIQLIPPHGSIGQLVNLAVNAGGSGRNFTGTTFSDHAASAVASGAAPFSGAFQPQSALAQLSGQLMDGAWQLAVTSSTPGRAGTLNGWSIDIATGPPFPILAVTDRTSGSSLASGASLGLGVGVFRQAPSGTRTIVLKNVGTAPLVAQAPALLGSNPADFVVSAPLFPASVPVGATVTFDVAIAPLDTGPLSAVVSFAHNATATAASPFNLTVTGIGVAKLLVVSSTAVPLAIPDVGSVDSAISVTSGGSVIAAIAALSITHTFDSDLEIDLVSPSGTSVVLSSHHGPFGQNYTSTIFDDTAATAIGAGSAPFTGRFTPDSPLGVLSGFDPNGAWTLHVTDTAVGDVGTLTAWMLELGLSPFPEIDVREGGAAGPRVSPGQPAANGRAMGDAEVNGAPSLISIAVLNTGTAPLNLTPPQVTGSAEISLVTTGFSGQVAPLGQTSFIVRFAPTALGPAAATVSFAHTASPTASPFTFGVTGNGAVGTLSVSRTVSGPSLANGSTVDFGTVSVGTVSPATVVLRNAGTVPVAIGAPILGGTSPGEFTLGGFPRTVSAASTASFTVTFAPALALPRFATLTFSHDANGAPSPFQIALTGVGAPRGIVRAPSDGGGGGGCSAGRGGGAETTTPAVVVLAIGVLLLRRRGLRPSK